MDSGLVVKRDIAGQADLDWGIVVQVGVSDDVLPELVIVPFTLAETDGGPVEMAKPLRARRILLAHLAAGLVPCAGQQILDPLAFPRVTFVRGLGSITIRGMLCRICMRGEQRRRSEHNNGDHPSSF